MTELDACDGDGGWRFLLATEQPEPIGSRVLPLNHVPIDKA